MGDVLMTYKESLIQAMNELAKDDNVRFLGYNTRFGHRFNGTLTDIPEDKLIEMPVAENLIMGTAMGMAFEGFKPVVCIERMDFLWACADAMVNHLNKAKELGWPPLRVIIRTCVGTDSPLDPGCQHKGNYYRELYNLLDNVLVMDVKTVDQIKVAYFIAAERDGPTMIVEYKELYPHSSYGVK